MLRIYLTIFWKCDSRILLSNIGGHWRLWWYVEQTYFLWRSPVQLPCAFERILFATRMKTGRIQSRIQHVSCIILHKPMKYIQVMIKWCICFLAFSIDPPALRSFKNFLFCTPWDACQEWSQRFRQIPGQVDDVDFEWEKTYILKKKIDWRFKFVWGWHILSGFASICLVGLWQKSRGTGGQVAFCCVFFFNANGTGIAKALRGSQFSGCKAKGAMLKTTPKLKNCHFCISSWKNFWAFFFSIVFFWGEGLWNEYHLINNPVSMCCFFRWHRQR